MDKYAGNSSDLTERLESIKAPQPAMPIYRQRLKSALIEQVRLSGKPARLSVREALFAMFFVTRRNMRYALPALAVFMLIAWQLLIPAPQTFAYIVLEVNPTIKLTIDTNNEVISFKAMDPFAHNILESLNLRNKNVQQAISEIVDKLHEQNTLVPNRRMFLVAYPVELAKQERLTVVLDSIHTALGKQLDGMGIDIAVQHFVIDPQTYEAARRAGLRPSQYVRLLNANLSLDMLAILFKVREEANIEKSVFVKHFAAIAELISDLLEAGISENEAVNIARELLIAGMSIDALDAMISRILDIVDDELNPDHALANIRQLIKYGQIHEEIPQRYEDVPDDVDIVDNVGDVDVPGGVGDVDGVNIVDDETNNAEVYPGEEPERDEIEPDKPE